MRGAWPSHQEGQNRSTASGGAHTHSPSECERSSEDVSPFSGNVKDMSLQPCALTPSDLLEEAIQQAMRNRK